MTLDYDTHLRLVHRMSALHGCKFVVATKFLKTLKRKDDEIPLSRWVNQLRTVKYKNVTYSTTDENGIVLYRVQPAKGRPVYHWGKVHEIFMKKTSREGTVMTELWFDIDRFVDLSTADRKKHGLDDWAYAGFKVVYNRQKKKDLVRVDELVGHGTSWKTPNGCFGIGDATLLITNLSKLSCTS